MAQIEDRKSRFYSQKQSVRDELSAPQYLESAGDILIKNLAIKQTNTLTTLQEQLEIVQNFEKRSELNPEVQKGIASLKEFQTRLQTREETCTDTPLETKEIQDVDELRKVTGLSRHELELSLCEKPSSTKAQLYKFAMSSKRQKRKTDLVSQLRGHPINKLKEIEEECFGHLKRERNVVDGQNAKPGEKRARKRKHGKRKRKKKGKGEKGESTLEEKQAKDLQPMESSVTHRVDDDVEESSSPPVSLWDVRDMKRWSESKKIGCAPRKYYTVKDGKIVQLEKDPA